MQFESNSDYPPEGTEVRPHQSFGPPQINRCDRFRTNVVLNGRPTLAEVVVPSPRSIRSPTQSNSNRGTSDDSDDSDSSDSDTSDDDLPTVESSHAFWLQRNLKPAIYGSVWGGAILRKLPEPFVAQNGETVAWEATNHRCAIKIYSRRHIMENQGSAENPMNEIAAMQYLLQYQHRLHGEVMDQDVQEGEQIFQTALHNAFESNVMMPLGVYFNATDIFNIMPYSDGGELFDVLDQRRSFPEPEARYWMHQILNGMETLQRAGICHRDMSLENLLTDRSGRALIIDMGMCIKIPYLDDTASDVSVMRFDDHRERQRCLVKRDKACGKPYYMSPEIRRNKHPFDGHAIDVWALGPILFLMVAGFPPWEIADPSDERFYYFSNGYFAQTVKSWNLGLSADLIDLLQRMFFINPKDRLGLAQVRAHPWMNGEVQQPPPR